MALLKILEPPTFVIRVLLFSVILVVSLISERPS